jgi:hypothetical protein
MIIAHATPQTDSSTSSTMTAPEVVVITPEMADQWLKLNTGNARKIHGNYVATYASDMANGRWDACADPICFKDGVLRNGQHRLAAIIRAGVSIPMLVHWDWQGDTFDSGRVRDNGTALTLLGIPQGKTVSAMYGLWEATVEATIAKANATRPSVAEVRDWYFSDPKTISRIISMPYVGSKAGCNTAYLKLIKSGISIRDVESFAEELRNGDGLKGHPIREFNRRYHSNNHLFKGGIVTASVILVWNKVAKGETSHKFYVPAEGSQIAKPIVCEYAGVN